MLRIILIYGVIAGVIVSVPVAIGTGWLLKGAPEGLGELIGYTIMIVALSTIFIAIKDYRDKTLGGVIRFLPALGIGLGISAVAGVFYVAGFEIYMVLSGSNFADDYFNKAIELQRAKGADATALAGMEQMRDAYRNPLIRMALSFFVEFLPVGVIISLISSALLRNSRFLPRRPAAA